METHAQPTFFPADSRASRPLTAKTPLGGDLLLVGFSGHEAISQLFEFRLDFLAENDTKIDFDKLLGQAVTVHMILLDGRARHFSGICKSVSEGSRDPTFTSYRMEVVPTFWLLSRRAQCRIFQQKTVPDILKEVLAGLDVAYEVRGTYHPRDYCVQYRETDFNFACRLMEEEGIFYYFRHSASGHTMVVSDTPDGSTEVPGSPAIRIGGSEEGVQGEDRITSWEKTQELRSGRFTLRDHCFETPTQNLEATRSAIDSVAVGAVTHKLRVAGNDRLEIYDYPGEYAQRFDGVGPGGGDRSADLNHLFTDNDRTVALRMQQESVAALRIHGTSLCRAMISGHTFRLEGHFNADGPYLLTSVEHSAAWDNAYRSEGADGEFLYSNSFSCIPAGLPFRPERRTPKPFVQGTQTAVVVGPAGEEIFTDKYGRVKVQFHWDRGGKHDAGSSCWVRVATLWAGSGWGMIQIPRIGQEVLVGFLEGDADQPIIVGGVYNADQMPPYELPANKTQSGLKSRSTLGGQPSNFNELRFEDKKGSEQVYIQAEKDLDTRVKNNESLSVGSNRRKSVGHDETTEIGHDRTESVGQNESITIGANRTESVGKDESITIAGNLTESVGKSASISIGQDQTLTVGKTLTIRAGDEMVLQCGAASVVLKKDGTISIKGMNIDIKGAGSINLKGGTSTATLDPKGVSLAGLMIQSEAQVLHSIKGMMTQINADAMLQTKGAITMMS
jgi:type VI secretion system secreted protein VgrG